MSPRVVYLHLVGLADAEVLLVTSGQEYPLSAVEHHRYSVVVGIDGVEEVPRTVFIVLGSGRTHKSGSVPTHHSQLISCIEHIVTETRQVKVGQALYSQLLLPQGSVCRRLRHWRQYSSNYEE